MGLAAGLGLLSGEEGEEVVDLLLAGERVGEGQVGLDRVVVAAAVASTGDIAGGGELGDDPGRGAFGDPDRLADFAQADAGVDDSRSVSPEEALLHGSPKRSSGEPKRRRLL